MKSRIFKSKQILGGCMLVLAIVGFNTSVRADAVTDWNAIAVQSVIVAGSTRPGPSASLDLAQEVVDARIFLGIHFRFADEVARTQGKKVANYGHKNYLRPGKGADDDEDNQLSEVRRKN